VNDLPFPVYLTSCSALSSDHLPVLIDTACRSCFQHPPDRPYFRRTDWVNFETHLEDQTPFNPELPYGMAIETCVENSSSAVLKALALSTPNCRQRDDPRPPIPGSIQGEIAWSTGCGGSGRSPVTPLWKPMSSAFNGRWLAGLTRGGTSSGARRSNPSILKTNRCGRWSCGWWEFLLRLSPGHPRLNRCLRLRESRSICRQSGGSVSAGDRSLATGGYWEGWRGAEVLPHDPCKRTQVNQHWGDSTSHQVSQGRQGFWPERYPKRALKYLPQRALSFLVLNFNVILATHHFPTEWKHARVISIP